MEVEAIIGGGDHRGALDTERGRRLLNDEMWPPAPSIAPSPTPAAPSTPAAHNARDIPLAELWPNLHAAHKAEWIRASRLEKEREEFLRADLSRARCLESLPATPPAAAPELPRRPFITISDSPPASPASAHAFHQGPLPASSSNDPLCPTFGSSAKAAALARAGSRPPVRFKVCHPHEDIEDEILALSSGRASLSRSFEHELNASGPCPPGCNCHLNAASLTAQCWANASQTPVPASASSANAEDGESADDATALPLPLHDDPDDDPTDGESDDDPTETPESDYARSESSSLHSAPIDDASASMLAATSSTGICAPEANTAAAYVESKAGASPENTAAGPVRRV
jgi:hypothetical protein